MHAYTVASCYLFTPLEKLDALKSIFLKAMKRHDILGTFILASEGLNAGFAGTPENIQDFYAFLTADPRFSQLKFRENYTNIMPFERRKVKLREEIVTLGVPGITALKTKETHLSPNEWNTLLEDPNVLVLDTRNDYEFALGKFKNAVDPDIKTFRDFPEYIQKNLLDKKKTKLATYCTGGIRCEKSTAYFQSLGFEEVYQLDGGILNYIDKMPADKSYWEGECFVFDERTVV
ncbi:MAG: rhodanese-like domain-containing protein [Legionellaceae bacterium]|nr:rhodanese-like domain-containing protein [Legionellaceae bacterium]